MSNYLTCLSVKFFMQVFLFVQRGGTEHEYFEIPVKDLNLEQLQALKVDHSSERGNNPGWY